MTPTPAPTGPFLPYLNPTPFDLSPPRLRPFLAAAPGLPASSTTMWKKSQGKCNGRAARRVGWSLPLFNSDLDPAHLLQVQEAVLGDPRVALMRLQVRAGDHRGGMLRVSVLYSAGPRRLGWPKSSFSFPLPL